MGGIIDYDQLHNMFNRPAETSSKAAQVILEMSDEADREHATETVNSLTAIVMETKNPLLADACRRTIALLLEEFAPSGQGRNYPPKTDGST